MAEKENIKLYSWLPGSSDAMRKPGGRDLADYKESLGFDERNLNGKRVLDLGSGPHEKLTSDLKKAGIDAEVISLNPDYKSLKFRAIINNQTDWQKKSFAGIGQQIPFKDNTFDFIAGLESVSMYEDAFEKPKSAEAWAREVVRVLRPGGEARFADLLGMGGEQRKQAWQKIIDILHGLEIEAYLETFTIKERDPRPRYRLVIKKPRLDIETK